MHGSAFLLLMQAATHWALLGAAASELLGRGHDIPRGLTGENENQVCRGDSRSVKEVEQAGGLFPHGYSVDGQRAPTTYSFKLDDHLSDYNGEVKSAYVSFTKSFAKAVEFAQQSAMLSETFVYPGMATVFVAATANNMVPLDKLVKFERHFEQEYLAIRGIPWAQIKGWYLIDPAKPINKANPVKLEDYTFHPNPDFRADVFEAQSAVDPSKLSESQLAELYRIFQRSNSNDLSTSGTFCTWCEAEGRGAETTAATGKTEASSEQGEQVAQHRQSNDVSTDEMTKDEKPDPRTRPGDEKMPKTGSKGRGAETTEASSERGEQVAQHRQSNDGSTDEMANDEKPDPLTRPGDEQMPKTGSNRPVDAGDDEGVGKTEASSEQGDQVAQHRQSSDVSTDEMTNDEKPDPRTRPGDEKMPKTGSKRPVDAGDDEGVGGKRHCRRERACNIPYTQDEIKAAGEELTPIAEKASADQFEMLASQHNLKSSTESTFKQSLQTFREGKLGYQKGAAAVPHLVQEPSRFGGKALASAGKALGVLGAGTYAYGVLEVMVKNASAVDRVAALTAIVPVVGCGASALAHAAEGNASSPEIPEYFDNALCVIGDILLFTPLAPVGVAVQVSRFVLTITRALDAYMSEPAQAKAARDAAWRTFLQDHMYRRLSSIELGAKIFHALAVESLALLSEGAHVLGILEAGQQGALNRTDNSTEHGLLRGFFRNTTEHIRANVSDEIAQAQRQVLLNLVYDALDRHRAASLRILAGRYNKAFVQDRLAGASERIKRFVRNDKPPMPSSLVVAYLIGQSTGQAAKLPPLLPASPSEADDAFAPPGAAGDGTSGNLHHLTLNFADYLRRKQNGLAKKDADVISIQQTHAVMQFLQGSIKFDDVAKASPSLSPSIALEFQILVSLKLGRLFQYWKPSADGAFQYFPESALKKPGMIESALDTATGFLSDLGKAYCETPVLKDLTSACNLAR
ncbi:hypothetical protein DCS_00082 [Drechmeria coniospora]|uniref:Heat Labile Enterotoxin Type Iib n=1 Tax=Drechmeria coniospora TaxID=98403 RepID=A0A151GPB1_DRECN|nr:hypothetical protein DCS_00082 [Drechmeria coniospora]KYK58955.1 hypothetical protein DCS_00082 [Drechmeria coniospora]